MNFHTFMALGRATKDPELLQSKKKTKFAKFSIAVNEYKKDEKEDTAIFYEAVVFGKAAESIMDNLKKGDLILLQGKPESEAYLSKDNQPKSKISVLVDKWQIIK